MKDRFFQWIILAAVLVSASFFSFSLNAGKTEKDASLYVDLMSSPAYVKSGFESAYASLTDPGLTEWGTELPPDHGKSLLVPGLSGEPPLDPSEFLRFGERTVREYTILIPFVMRAEMILLLYDKNNPVTPGLYLAGIGENWEMYINGSAIAKNLYLRPDGGIASFRSKRGVTIPFDRRILVEGKNFLVIRIVGAPSSGYTGLFHTSPYYIGDFTRVSSHGESLQEVALCAVYFFIGLYHILLYALRRTDVYNLLCGAFSCTAAMYFFARCPAIYRVFENTAHAQRIEFASLYLLVFMLAAFLEALNVGRLKPVTIAYGISSITLIVLQCVFTIWFASDLLTVWRFYASAFFLYIVVVDIIYAYIKQVRERQARLRESGGAARFGYLFFRGIWETELGNVFIFMMINVCAIIFDMLDAAFFHRGIFLTRLSCFAFMCSMVFTLARKYANLFARTARMNDELEETVRLRTSQLESQVLIAEAASRAKGGFLANMSHEIRTPLNAVIGMAKIGAQAGELAQKDYAFKRIGEASDHLLGIINDILDISKIEAGKFELSESRFRVRDIVSSVKNVMRFKSDEKAQEFSAHVAADVPEVVLGDKIRLMQVLTNLVGNAIKFTPEKGRVTLSATFDGEVDGLFAVRFQVQDSGIGITPEQKAKLFKPFQQADSNTTRKYGGTGLGLALSKEIVELMGGEIWVESTFGQGAVFGFTVKVRRTDSSPVEEDETAAEEGLKAGEFEGRVILLADDVEINREIVMASLELSGVIIECAENGRKAAEMFEESPVRYDLVLMDLQMPELDGYEATKRIRSGQSREAAQVPIIAMTANVFQDDIERSLACGMNEHLGKPIRLDAMLGVLRKYLKKNSQKSFRN
ncbi:MAG: response regulator [Desulfovibrio sp.]|jgi:signal transduction histidine kinase/ActR/RegA family two-component response regulator|nr:response regulator [Desulfovibrio sp.]